MMILRIVSALIAALCIAGAAQELFPAQETVADSSQAIADRIVNAKMPVLVDFWAPWCGPCRMLDPKLKKLEKLYHGRVLFLKVNSDYHRQISSYFRIQGIPAVFFIKDRTVVRALVGLQPEEAYRAALDELIAMPSPLPGKTGDSGSTKKSVPGKK